MEGEAMSAHERHHCKECNKALVEGRAYELGGYRWHVDCFICSVCSRKLNADTNMLVLGNGTLVCNNCSYYCNICHTKIEKLAILTNDQAFCSNCFICRNCKKPIEDLKYARTPHGIFCMSCHNIFMARKLHRQSRRVSTQSANSAHRHKQLPTLPGMPRNPNSRTNSSSTVPQLGSPLTGTPVAPANTSVTPTNTSGVHLQEDSASEYEEDPEDWVDRTLIDDSSKALSNIDLSLPGSRSASTNASANASVVASPEALLTPSDSVPTTNPTAITTFNSAVLSESGSAPKASDSGSSSNLDTYSLVAASNTGKGITPISPTDTRNSPHSLALQPISSNRSTGSTRSSARSFHARTSLDSTRPTAIRDSIIGQSESDNQSTPDVKRASSITNTTPSGDFHSARQSIESNADQSSKLESKTKVASRDALASPMAGDRESMIKSETSKFDIDLQKALLSSPPPMSLNLKDRDNDHDSSPELTGSPTHRRSQLTPHTPRGDLTIPPRSPARSLSRAGSPESIASSMSLQRSPELIYRETRSELRSSGVSLPAPTPDLATELSVPKRSTRRGTSPNARTAIAQATRGSNTTSAPGPLPTSPRWNRNLDGISSIGSVGHSARQHKRSFSENQDSASDTEGLLRSLVVAQHRIRALEQKLNSQGDDALLERKSTIATLEARKTIAREELAALHSAKEESNRDAQLSEFGTKLADIKNSLERDIADLVERKEALKVEVGTLADARDKAIEESSMLNLKNSQLVDLNNELVKETMEKFASSHAQEQSHSSSSSPSRIWEKRKPKRKEVGSGTRAPSGPQSTTSAGSHVSNTSGPSPYMRSSGSASNGATFHQIQTATQVSAPSSQQPGPGQGQFVTVLNPQEQSSGADKKNKLWPWKRTQRGTPRTVEIDELNSSFNAAVTHLNSNGGPHSGMGGNHSTRSVLLGESLEERVELDGVEVPILVTRCIEEVEKRGLDLEGIYRKSGSKSQIDALMEHFETHSPDTASTLTVDISAVTSALKQYLRYLNDPVITYQNYDDFVRAGRTQNIASLRTLVSGLPPAHNRTLTALITHLVIVKEHGHRNLMTTVNLATVFAPTLTRDITGDREMADMQARNDATQLLIDNFDAIFDSVYL